MKDALSREGIPSEVELVAVNTDEEAGVLGFPGSPTIRVDGRDLFLSSVGGRVAGSTPPRRASKGTPPRR
ncbi:MAG: DUF2703 domain-containing protein [Actinomycetota bacterium]|nr:DUF2703 domain-containing protein [Actinomycetota bacterium]